MDEQTTPLVIGLDTQYEVARAIYERFHANGHRTPRPWDSLDAREREPWRGAPPGRGTGCRPGAPRAGAVAADRQGRDQRDRGQSGDGRHAMSPVALLLLALAILIGWLGGRR